MNGKGRKSRRRWFWRIAALGIFVVAALVVTRAVLFRGLLQPVRVVSGSMANSLYGSHYRVACADCGTVFRCDIESPPPDMTAVCPNCGYGNNELTERQLQVGQRVLVDALPQLTGGFERWQAVAFYPPGENDKLTVKRLVGFPGEELAIRGGDIFVDGRRLRKMLPEQRAVAILVHDNDFRPNGQKKLPSRWQTDGPDSHWQEVEGGFRFEPPAESPAKGSPDWLTYRHWRCTLNPLPRTEEAEVRDNYGYNQGLSRTLHVVADLMLACRIKLTGRGRLRVSAHDGYETLRLVIAPNERQLSLQRRGEVVETRDWPARLQEESIELEVSLFDRQLLLAANGETLLRYPLDLPKGPMQPTSRPFGLAAENLTLKVSHLRIYRDVHYLDPTNRYGDWQPQKRLGVDEYFMLGDNVPISRDSRLWKQPLTHKSLIGKVLAF